MANKSFRTLMDLAAEGANLQARCAYCPNGSILEGAALSRYFGLRRWAIGLPQVGLHLRCCYCSKRDPRLKVVFKAPTSPWRHPISEWEWRQLTKRLRG